MQLSWTPIGLRYYAPAVSLRGLVSSYYIFHADLPKFSDLLRADLPQLRFILSGDVRYIFADGRSIPIAKASLIGPTYGAYRIDVKGPLLVFGVGLLPAGWSSLVRIDASDLSDRMGDAEALLGKAVTEAAETLREMATPTDMVRVADRLLTNLLARMPDSPHWFTQLTDQWLTSSPSPVVNTLIASTGMSGRQVERLTKRIYGAPPKLLGRKYRALKAAAELAKGDAHWSDVAGDSFADQSHFIREFRQFVGLTPTQLMANPPPVTRLTLERRRLNSVLPELTKIA